MFLLASSAVLGQNHPLWAFFPVTAPTWPPFLSLLTVLSYKITFRNHLLQAAFPDHLPPADPPRAPPAPVGSVYQSAVI